MPASLRFVFAIHNHQPVGNFDKVLEQAHEDSYRPFLDLVERYPEFKFGFHTSGPLFEWWERRHPDQLERLARLARRGQMEVIGGGFYEPILPLLPERDRRGQIRAFTEYLERRLGAKVEGMWLAERVWEQGVVKSIVDAGIRWTVVDDFHFLCSGLAADQLQGYHVTDEEGRVLRVFNIAEDLRYRIPFRAPKDTVDYLRSLATEAGDRVVVYADDGEKFGVWPRTKKHVYGDRWLERFFEAILAESSWLKLSSFSEAVREVRPVGRVYLPDCSYREMTEWALPVDTQLQYEDAVAEVAKVGAHHPAKRFLRGGTWRNFLSRYPESAVMHAKMRHVSERVDALPLRSRAYEEARQALYRGQCNCAYWHGVFGGLYLPHLRDAVYRNLLAAEVLTREYGAAGAGGPTGAAPPVAERRDFDLDGEEEVHVTNGRLGLYVKPGLGGHVYEFDVLDKGANLLNGLARRRESYHRKVKLAKVVADADGVESIHDMVLAKEEGLQHRLHVDPHWRMALMDHFLGAGATLEAYSRGSVRDAGDFLLGVYGADVRSKDGRVEVALARDGRIGGRAARVEKVLTLGSGTREVEVAYAITNLSGERLDARFGSEWNFALLAGRAHDRYLVGADGRNLGPLATQGVFADQGRFSLVDEWQGIRVNLHFEAAADLWVFPVETVSQSEAGFELVYQSTSVTPCWSLALAPGSSWRTRFVVAIEG
ncbi:MAG: DUF1926 domain-containing protein [Planctomycetes bacterium]|nr:DUF1926 domain-containing protein [Planctomycetota bacterium]